MSMSFSTSRPLHSLRTAALAATAATALGAGATLAFAPSASAAAPAPSTVTIKAEGTDLSGTVSSPRRVCKDERKVIVYKQKGARGGGDDIKFASDTTELQGGVGQWNTGNTGTEGRFYAKVKKTDQCGADTSPTIRATANP